MVGAVRTLEELNIMDPTQYIVHFASARPFQQHMYKVALTENQADFLESFLAWAGEAGLLHSSHLVAISELPEMQAQELWAITAELAT